MLYLFNSAFRPLYLTNVLNTLALPQGCSNEYRYKHTGDSRQISPGQYAALNQIPQNEPCVIIFIDRFGENGYIYHPLRFAKFLIYRDINEYIHFRVELTEYIYPRRLDAFNHDVRQALGQLGMPVLTDGNPLNTRDGNYAITADSIFGNSDEFQKGNIAWNAAVEKLAGSRALATNQEQSPVFLMLNVQTSDKHRSLAPKLVNNAALFRFEKNTRYESVVTYRFPRQRIDQTARGTLQLDFGDSVKGQETISIDSHANSIPVAFVTKKYVEENRGKIGIIPIQDEGRPILLMANIVLEYEFYDSVKFWLQVAVALLLFSLLSTLIGIDFSGLHPFTFRSLICAGWIKFVIAFAQTAVLFWLFRLVGKKVL